MVPRLHLRFAAPVATIVALVGALVAPMPATAHAEVVASTPAAGANLPEPPERLEIEFSEPIDPELAVVELLDASQASIAGVGEVQVDEAGTLATVELPALEDGVYTVTYQVVSTVDGHATAGSFAFVVDPSGTQAPPPSGPSSEQPAVDAAAVAARWVALIGALLTFGSLVAAWRSRPLLPAGASVPPWLLIAGAATIGFVGLAAYLVLSARPIVEAAPERAAGLPFDFAAPYGSTPFANAMRLSLAGLAVSALAGWLAVAVEGLGRGTAAAAITAGVASVAGLLGMSLAGHASATGGIGFGLLDWGHLLAAGAWLGGLPALAILGRRHDAASGARVGARALFRRHGAVAIVAAPIVALTGIANSPLVLGSTRGLVASEYGNLLLAKVILLSVAVAIGAVNHFALRNRGRAPTAFLVGVELVVAALAIGAAATMVTIQPASARQATVQTPPVAPAHLFGEAGIMSVHATVDLPTPGPQRYLVTVVDAATNEPRDDVQRVFLEVTPPPGSDLAPERIELERDGAFPGFYSASGAYLSVEGEWGVDVVVRRAGELDERASFTVPVVQRPEPQLVPPPDTGIGVPAPLGMLWSVLPAGIVGWLPGALTLGLGAALGLVALGRNRPVVVDVVRAALFAVGVIALLGAGSRTLVSAATAPTPDELEAHRPPQGFEYSPEDGEALYLANCASCHGVDGEGDGPVRTLPDAGPLADPVARLSSEELSYRIANGIAGTPMPAFAATLTETERWQLVRYLEARWKEP